MNGKGDGFLIEHCRNKFLILPRFFYINKGHQHMPRPELPTHEMSREKLCYTCRHYGFEFRPGTEYGWAYCRRAGKWFPDQQHGIPAGERSCKNWE